METIQLEKKFKNAIKEMQAKHNHSIVQLDHVFEKTISNRPRYQPDASMKSQADKSGMRSQMHSRKNLVSAKGSRRVWKSNRLLIEKILPNINENKTQVDKSKV